MNRLIAATMVSCCCLLPGAHAQEPWHFEIRMLGGNSFDPATIAIKVGNTITWINDDDNSFHTATSDDGTTFDTRVESLSHSNRVNRFTAAGEIAYHCRRHPAMKGRIIVSP